MKFHDDNFMNFYLLIWQEQVAGFQLPEKIQPGFGILPSNNPPDCDPANRLFQPEKEFIKSGCEHAFHKFGFTAVQAGSNPDRLYAGSQTISLQR
jgi:hypothetical protein